ncbi:hypothetical protein ABK040_013608 [Willaertia magna]
MRNCMIDLSKINLLLKILACFLPRENNLLRTRKDLFKQINNINDINKIYVCERCSTTSTTDGGIRRGTDIFKAIALGADAVMIGRPYLYGLTVHGQEGVERVISLLHRELRLCMQLCGCESLNDIREKGRDLIVFPNDIYSLYSNNDCCKLSKL